MTYIKSHTLNLHKHVEIESIKMYINIQISMETPDNHVMLFNANVCQVIAKLLLCLTQVSLHEKSYTPGGSVVFVKLKDGSEPINKSTS